jgi:hypothetical protein
VKPTTWAKWLRGIIGAVIGGVSSSFIVTVIDPTTFNLTTYGGSMKLLLVFGWAAGFGAFSYLKEHPLPDEDDLIIPAGAPAPVVPAWRCPTCGATR